MSVCLSVCLFVCSLSVCLSVVYLWQCILCKEENSYFGRTIQKAHERTNTHRGCFNDPTKWENSALSMHARSVHGENFNLNNFKITLVKKCSPQRIRRVEFKYIDKYRTRTRGINRYKNWKTKWKVWVFKALVCLIGISLCLAYFY